MAMNDLYIKKAYDQSGTFKHLELHQGDNVICIKYSTKLDEPRSWHWNELKRIIDNHQETVKQETMHTLHTTHTKKGVKRGTANKKV